MCGDQAPATGMTLAAVLLGLAVTEEMTAADQTTLANLLLAAGQAIATRASLLPEGTGSRHDYRRIERLEERLLQLERGLTAPD